MLLKNYIKDYIRSNDKRNPLFVIDGVTISVIGDVHLGRVFKTGVPKHRIGERESIVGNQFFTLLQRKANYCVVVGDLFDKVRVSNGCLNTCIDMLSKVSEENPTTQYIILSGNHDMSKDKDKISSFQLLEKYFTTKASQFSNVTIVSSYLEPIQASENLLLYFSHYNPFKSLDEEGYTFNQYKDVRFKIAFGHWEVTDFGSTHFIDRGVPKVLIESFDLIVTGHEHKPTLVSVKGVPVYVTGSMQPYAFNEELSSEKSLYVSLKPSELLSKLSKDENTFKYTNVRVLLDSTDEMPEPFECFSLTYKNIGKLVIKSNNENGASEVELVEKDTVTFQHSFGELVTNLKDANTDHSDFLDNILKTFLDKSYKGEV